MKKLKYRHELKFLISEGEKELIRERLQVIMKLDPHATNGEYHIRSLYFDDYWNSAYEEKMGGFSLRRKYRIRVYDLSDKIINLECKLKSGSYISKQSARLSPQEFQAIQKGDYAFLLKREEHLCRDFYYQCTSKVLRPRVIVDYEREPFMMEAGTVRVTFDKQVRAISPVSAFFSANLPCHYVLEPGKVVMEVKYTEFLPSIVKRVLPPRAAEFTAVSKYALCYEKVEHLMAKTSF
ncbi:MAG: polyphosphate polymerase domain-containing protein [Clostridia bacterium]